MLRYIELLNFKCFENLKLACAPLTLLSGLNSSGKSSVFQALLVLRQSFSSGDLCHGRLTLNGELVELGTGHDLIYEDANSKVVSFLLHLDDGVVGSFVPVRKPVRLVLVFDYSKPDGKLEIRKNDDGDTPKIEPRPWARVPPLGGKLMYVDAERIGPRKFYSHSGSLPRIGTLDPRRGYAVNFLYERQNESLAKDDPRVANSHSRRLLDVVDHWLQAVTPGVHLQLETIPDADAVLAGFSFGRFGDAAGQRYRATNVGFGLSYVLPVLTGLLARPGTLCLIENPEAHLHPRGQTRLAELAVCASLAGVQVIAETHSDHFVDGVRIAVRDGLLRPEDVAIHHFERTDGKTAVTSPRLDSDGRLSSWSEGLLDQHEENLARLLAPKTGHARDVPQSRERSRARAGS